MKRVAVYSIVRGRRELTEKSFSMLWQRAGIPFDHYVADNGSDDDLREWLTKAHNAGKIHTLQLHDNNYGQNIATNWLLDEMGTQYEWVVRWDNDMVPRTWKFLKKLVRTADKTKETGNPIVLSPRILKLEEEPPAIAEGTGKNSHLQAVSILGGACRLHPAEFFGLTELSKTWRFSKFGALGFGEALEVVARCLENGIPLIRDTQIEVEHAYGTKGQAEKYPEYFRWEEKEIRRYVSYGL